ncbi:hypothetical protein [Streptacidiphilus carbonis]|jgi:hypothetical protein|uniref:hypothetical protein n=1 Tax=Streptacidiphilus carbonis TaxID=105422 RepID=UPI0005A616AA
MDTGPETHRLPEDPFGLDGSPSSHPALIDLSKRPRSDLSPLTPLPPADSIGEAGLEGRELRPAGLLRLWQVIPIAALAIFGSLLFAFPLAFQSGDAGRFVGMLGLLLTTASAGWGGMAARRAGYAWPGLPRQGSGRRAGWRALLAYAALVGLALALGWWRVARIGA